MRYTASIHIYDALSSVQVAATVTSWPESGGECRPENVLVRSTSLAGVGENDPAHWLLEALHELIEAV